MEDYELSLRLRRGACPWCSCRGASSPPAGATAGSSPCAPCGGCSASAASTRAGADIREIARQYRDIR